MRQHPINLLPASIRARNQAGMRAGRFIAVAVVCLGGLIVTATHSRLRLINAQGRLGSVTAQAEEVFAIDAQAADLKKTLDRTQASVALYEDVAFPLNVSAVMATVINGLPRTVTLDQFDVSAGARAAARTPRGRGGAGNQDGGGKPEAPPRVLKGEVSGFAASDQEIAELVSRLESTPPFQSVNLDFSRTRKINDLDAREFRLSFQIDLDAAYEVAYRDAGAAPQAQGHEH